MKNTAVAEEMVPTLDVQGGSATSSVTQILMTLSVSATPNMFYQMRYIFQGSPIGSILGGEEFQ